jgi:hypothetical protein
VTVTIAGCSEPAASPALRAAPASYLLSVDELVSPDFSLDTAPHSLTVAGIAGTDSSIAQQLNGAGFTAGASEDFFRSVGSLALANGPVQVRDTVEEFASSAGASTVYGADISRLDAVAGAVAMSTGSLGDAAHATTRDVTSPDGVTAVEITVEWRVANLLSILVVRGRSGGTRLDDALILAHRETVIELGLTTPTAPTPTASG